MRRRSQRALGAVGSVRRLTITRGINGRGAKDLGLLPNFGPGYASVAEAGKNGRQILEGLAAGEMRGLLMLGPNPALEAAGDLLERAVRKAACVVAFDTRPGRRLALRDSALPRPRDLREGRQRHQRRRARAAHPRRPAAGVVQRRWRRAC